MTEENRCMSTGFIMKKISMRKKIFLPLKGGTRSFPCESYEEEKSFARLQDIVYVAIMSSVCYVY